ncbi:hypothetical protein J5N97_026369 [Dioscorea zingiberensis]|uniref:O-methyltransferase C-terminal domain-containing protein n=1 Tax=Dioscorea zingiberensis TaxID=325984 RepID=A0A9D5C251_9LILI|nr:hypothetical protein J5N97_026369 [Dioscorea zingiberensis]
MAPLALMNQDKVLMDNWYYLKDVVLQRGILFNMADGMTTFEYHGTDPRFNKVFNEGMNSHSVIIMKKILEKYCDFDHVKVLVDVGGVEHVGGEFESVPSEDAILRWNIEDALFDMLAKNQMAK